MDRKVSRPAIWIVVLSGIAFLIYGMSNGGLGSLGMFLKHDRVQGFIFAIVVILIVLLFVIKVRQRRPDQ